MESGWIECSEWNVLSALIINQTSTDFNKAADMISLNQPESASDLTASLSKSIQRSQFLKSCSFAFSLFFIAFFLRQQNSDFSLKNSGSLLKKRVLKIIRRASGHLFAAFWLRAFPVFNRCLKERYKKKSPKAPNSELCPGRIHC